MIDLTIHLTANKPKQQQQHMGGQFGAHKTTNMNERTEANTDTTNTNTATLTEMQMPNADFHEP